jgi:hypothetical protein
MRLLILLNAIKAWTTQKNITHANTGTQALWDKGWSVTRGLMFCLHGK